MSQISAGPHVRLVIAPFVNRANAYIVDALIAGGLGVVAAPLTLVMPAAAVVLVWLVLPFAWPIVWLRTCSATPGKLLCRLSVQPVPGPGRLSWRSILARVGVATVAPALVATTVLLATGSSGDDPVAWVVTALTAAWALVDCLSSLGNTRRQALHDRAAATVVVQRIRAWQPPPHHAPAPGSAMPSTPHPAPPAPGQ